MRTQLSLVALSVWSRSRPRPAPTTGSPSPVSGACSTAGTSPAGASAPRWTATSPKVGDVAETFDGKAESSDAGRYSASDGILTVNFPKGRDRLISQLYTVEEFPRDFTLKLEFRASVNADSGIFLRKPQLQCRDYPVAGPYKDLKKYKPQDWNQIEVVVKGGVARCTCNGEVLEAEFKLPETGPIGLEGDRGQMEYRRIQIK